MHFYIAFVHALHLYTATEYTYTSIASHVTHITCTRKLKVNIEKAKNEKSALQLWLLVMAKVAYVCVYVLTEGDREEVKRVTWLFATYKSNY